MAASMPIVQTVTVPGGRVFFEAVAIPGHAEYEAGYSAGLHNAEVELMNVGTWMTAPIAASDQWGMGHRDGFKEGLRRSNDTLM